MADREIEIDGVKYGYINILKGDHKENLEWIAMCLISHSGPHPEFKTEELINLQEFNVSSQGIHIRMNDADFFIRGKKMATELELWNGER
jgi:hypothetical protein